MTGKIQGSQIQVTMPLCLLLAVGIALQGCGKKETMAVTATPQAAMAAPATATNPPTPAPTPAATPTASPVAVLPAAATPPAPEKTTATTWTPEALEELLAPVALYPDGVLAQVLSTATRPQEVLDAGNWLIEHPGLKGKELESAATALGFTQAMVALMQFPDVVDMMCLKMDWTTELGSAFLADEPAVLAAVQRLRKQAAEIGNLKSSEQLKVESQTINNQDVITVNSPDPKVVYVPQYNPVTTYTTPAPAATTTTTTTAATTTPKEEGHSTAALVTTGLLAFGAGILVNEALDDDDEDYYPYWGGGPAFYPAPYYPVYGNGFHPSHKYNNSFNGNNVIINTGRDDYWKRFDGNRASQQPRRPNSPISQARPNRPQVNPLDQGDWKGKSAYAGAQPAVREKMARNRRTTATPAINGTNSNYAGNRPMSREATGNRAPGTRPATREIASGRAGGDRGRSHLQVGNQPSPARNTVFQGVNQGGQFERAASRRGRESVQRQSRQGGKRQAGGRRR